METVEISRCCEFERLKTCNFLECQCENYKNKCYSCCDICSENKLLRQLCDTNCDNSSDPHDSSSFSEE